LQEADPAIKLENRVVGIEYHPPTGHQRMVIPNSSVGFE
jgi:hypothetical protein